MTRKPASARKRTSPKSVSVSTVDRRMIETLLNQLVGGIPADDPPLDAAQEIIYEAWEVDDRRRRVTLAKRALEVSPLCADAYVLLAQDTARNLDEAIDYYRRGVAAGEKALGKACFRDEVGHFWGILETRPYMRAREGLAETLWDRGLRDEAVTHYRDMLRLNPNDNQGIRYLLLNCLLFLGRDQDAAELIATYEEDGSAAWTWSRTLLAFRRSGNCTQSRDALSGARSDNQYVAPLLLGDQKMPRRLPDYYSWGDKNEAVVYVNGAAPAWAAAAGALDWLRACQQ